jgi:hypothetical protein
MIRLSTVFCAAIFSLFLAAACFPQTHRRVSNSARIQKKPVATPAPDGGFVSGRTYTNHQLGFQVTFPNAWLIPGTDFEKEMKTRGFDLSLKAPDSLPPLTRAKLERAVENVKVLLTAYRSVPGSSDNAIVRISVEDLSLNPQIRDAVDYIDAVRSMYSAMKLPADLKYSETQAERLGTMQFGFLDSESGSGKKRMYATVRGGAAIIITISYKSDSDLETLRRVLTTGNFALK